MIGCSIGSAQNITFDPAPVDTTAVVGGNATFTCIPLADGSPGIAAWSITPLEQNTVIVLNETNVSGTSDSSLLGDDRRTMVLVNVSKELNGSTVLCTGFDQMRLSSARAPLVTLFVGDPEPGEWTRLYSCVRMLMEMESNADSLFYEQEHKIILRNLKCMENLIYRSWSSALGVFDKDLQG